MGAVSTTMKANWKKRTWSNTKGLDSFHALSRCAITFEQESMARAERHATAIGGSFIVRRYCDVYTLRDRGARIEGTADKGVGIGLAANAG